MFYIPVCHLITMTHLADSLSCLEAPLCPCEFQLCIFVGDALASLKGWRHSRYHVALQYKWHNHHIGLN